MGLGSLLTGYEGKILEKLEERGWNPYRSTEAVTRGVKKIITAGPELHLLVDERYVLLPAVQDPKDYAQVMGALERVAIVLDRETPTIKIEGQAFPWTGFIPLEEEVKVNTIQGHVISYPDFVKALGTIIDIKGL